MHQLVLIVVFDDRLNENLMVGLRLLLQLFGNLFDLILGAQTFVIPKALADLERVRLLFDDLETRREVIDLLGRAEQAEGVRIFIGSENKLFSLSGSSTIVAPYHDPSGQIVGVLGVIGPTRLNYARIIPMVDYTAKVVSKLLAG